MRQLNVTGLCGESLTFFPTNDRPERQTGAGTSSRPTPGRNHVENRLGEQITFFHLDCPCRVRAARRTWTSDLTLTVVADLVVSVFGRAFERVRSGPTRHTVFWKFVDKTGSVKITADEIVVRLSKRGRIIRCCRRRA